MPYSLDFSENAKKQISLIRYEQAQQKKLKALLDSILANPFTGIGKPEKLKHYDDERWSRRIDKKNRLVYKVNGSQVTIISIIGHY